MQLTNRLGNLETGMNEICLHVGLPVQGNNNNGGHNKARNDNGNPQAANSPPVGNVPPQVGDIALPVGDNAGVALLVMRLGYRTSRGSIFYYQRTLI